MKRILILTILCTVFVFSSVSAEIRRSVDEFTGGTRIICNTYLEENKDLDVISFRKLIIQNLTEFEIYANSDTYKSMSLGREPIEINIDGAKNTKLEIKEYKKFLPINGKEFVASTVSVPQEIMDQIKQANRIALKFTQNNGFTFVYVLPDNALAEWKQVINTEK
jgi:hypothetical protein